MNKCKRCGKPTKNPGFCSRRCVGLYNIEGGMKSRPLVRICEVCGKKFTSPGILRKRCFECSPRYISKKDDPDGFRTCSKCRKLLPIDRFTQKSRNYCRSCSSRYDLERATQLKLKVITHMGGKCQICGYSKCQNALDLHHPNGKEDKDMTWTKLRKYSWKRIKKEISNCVLLCANCHREAHSKNIGEQQFNIKLSE